MEIKEDHIDLDENQSYQLTAAVTPAEWPGELEWVSSDPSVATVSDSGQVHWVGAGTCTITVHAGDKSDSVEVTCAAPFIDNLLDNWFGENGDNEN